MYNLDGASMLFGMILSYLVGIVVSTINCLTEKGLYYRHKRKNGDKDV